MECKENHNGKVDDEYIVVEKQLAKVTTRPFSPYTFSTHRGRERVCVEALRLYAEGIVQVSRENSAGRFITLTDIP